MNYETAKQVVNRLLIVFEELTQNCPDNEVQFSFHGWSAEYTSNFLLHFIEAKGLTSELKQMVDIFNSLSDT